MTEAGPLVAELSRRGLTVAVAESLTGGLLSAALIGQPGASSVVLGGVVAYSTELKHTLLGVDAGLLAENGPVDPEVAKQMASGARSSLAVGGRPADIGLSTTGVAGPDPQGGKPPGLVFLGMARGDRAEARELRLGGSRNEVRARVVAEALRWLGEELGGAGS